MKLISLPEVREILDFADNGRLLDADKPPSGADVIVTRDLPRDGDQTGCDLTPMSSLASMTYGDIQAHAASKFILHPRVRAAKSELYEWFYGERRIEASIYRRLPRKYAGYATWIVSDMYMTALSRIAFGINEDALFEKIYSIYRDGGWPCGWSGRYPDSVKLIAFYLHHNTSPK